MAAIFQTAFLNGFSSKCINFDSNLSRFVPEGPLNKIPALVQVMLWRQPGDEPLPKPMMVCLLMHIYVTLPH